MILRRTLAAVAVATALTASAVHAQETDSTETFADRVEVTEVLLDALVTDGDGNVVVGLGADDFVVEEEGEAVELTAAYFYSNLEALDAPARAAETGVLPGTSPSDRYFILFFHDQRRSLGRLARQQMLAGRDAKEWVATGREPADYVAVASFGSRLELHQDFTLDTSALQRAIDEAVVAKRSGKEWSSRRPAPEEGTPSLLTGLPTGKELGKKSRDIYEALDLLSGAARPIVGRKNLLMFTAGFGEIDQNGFYRAGDRDMEKLKDDLNASNIALYAIETLPAFTEHPLRNALTEVAHATAGRVYYNFTRFYGPLETIGRETTGYYLLAYRSERATDEDSFREVEVTMRNPEFKVDARRGYRPGAR